ncbi:MAG: TatD family hydrolase [Pseudomonadota bacterium]|nr:TatD family hydrolase [Pseudomonadota bacterium]
MYVDSHCHLSSPELAARLPQIEAEMASAGVDRALVICTTLDEFEAVHAIAAARPNFWCSVGVHPDDAASREPSVELLQQLAGRAEVVAIGETGLDYFRLGTQSVADMEWQRQRFRVHIRAARASALPLVIHTRSASDDTLRVLREEDGAAAGGVFHCFTETEAIARAALDLGFYISFSGILTFKAAVELRGVAAFVPLDRCLIETDSPYLAPVPHRGKTNTPANVPYVARQLAEVKGLTEAEVAAATSANFERLFAKTLLRAEWHAQQAALTPVSKVP